MIISFRVADIAPAKAKAVIEFGKAAQSFEKTCPEV